MPGPPGARMYCGACGAEPRIRVASAVLSAAHSWAADSVVSTFSRECASGSAPDASRSDPVAAGDAVAVLRRRGGARPAVPPWLPQPASPAASAAITAAASPEAQP